MPSPVVAFGSDSCTRVEEALGPRQYTRHETLGGSRLVYCTEGPPYNHSTIRPQTSVMLSIVAHRQCRGHALNDGHDETSQGSPAKGHGKNSESKAGMAQAGSKQQDEEIRVSIQENPSII